MLPLLLLAHARQDRLHHEQHALDVDGEDAVPLLLGHLLETRRRVDAGVAAEDVDAPELVDGSLDGGRTRRLVGDVGLHENGLGAGAAQLFGGRGAGALVDVDDDDVGALRGEHAGYAAPDALGGAGYDGGLVVESSTHWSPPGGTA